MHNSFCRRFKTIQPNVRPFTKHETHREKKRKKIYFKNEENFYAQSSCAINTLRERERSTDRANACI